jgi:hypothetical protein
LVENVRELPPPVLLSAIVCDMVIVDALTGKGTVVGIFDTINAPAYPARHDSLFVFCQLTNGRGQVPVRIRIIDLADDEPVLYEKDVVGNFEDVKQVANVVLRVGGLEFPHPGEYRVQVYAGTEFLGERRILCRELPAKSGGVQ